MVTSQMRFTAALKTELWEERAKCGDLADAGKKQQYWR
jgi:hypothetical protein